MPTQKLTEKSIRAMPAPDANGKPVIYWDDDLRGFGVLCSGRTNAKTYVVQRGLGDGRRRRVTIAACNVLTLAEARGKAEQVLSDFYAGRDPKAGRKEKITLHEALENYLAANKKLSAASRRYYRLYVEKHLDTWCDVPLKMITPEMVEARHRKIQKVVADENKNGHATANQAMITLRIHHPLFSPWRSFCLPHARGRRSTRRPKVQTPPRKEAAVQNGRRSQFVLSWAASHPVSVHPARF